MLYQSSNVEFIWSALKSAISTAVSLFTPMRVIHNGSHPAWFNSGIRHKINQLNTLRRKKSSSSCLSKISVLEAQLRDNIISAKSQYESELVLNFSYSDSSKVFKYIKSFSKQSILPQVDQSHQCPWPWKCQEKQEYEILQRHQSQCRRE